MNYYSSYAIDENTWKKCLVGVSLIKLVMAIGLTNVALIKFYFSIRNDSSYMLKLPNGVCTNLITLIKLIPCLYQTGGGFF